MKIHLEFDTDDMPFDENTQALLKLLAGHGEWPSVEVQTEKAEPAKTQRRKKAPAETVATSTAPDEEDEPTATPTPEEKPTSDDVATVAEPTMEDAVAKATELVSANKQDVVKAALKKVGARRVTELKGDGIKTFLEALDG